MTKTQMNALLVQMGDITVTKKDTPKLEKIMADLRLAIKSSKSGKNTGPERFITINDINYQWCNRHEVYEPTTNFKEKTNDCILSVKIHGELTKLVNIANKEFDKAVDEDRYEDLKELKETKQKHIDVRSARYNIDDDITTHGDFENYDVKYVKLDAV